MTLQDATAITHIAASLILRLLWDRHDEICGSWRHGDYHWLWLRVDYLAVFIYRQIINSWLDSMEGKLSIVFGAFANVGRLTQAIVSKARCFATGSVFLVRGSVHWSQANYDTRNPVLRGRANNLSREDSGTIF